MRRIIQTINPSELELYQQHGWALINSPMDDGLRVYIDTNNGRNYMDTDYIETHNPYLIQRGLINRPLGELKGKRFFQTINFDYMGSAEFEFGALPASLTRMRVLNFKAKLNKFDAITYNGQPLRFWSYYQGEELETIKKGLLRLRGGDLHTKEWTHFNELDLTKCNIWWDIINDVVFSFDKLYMNRLGEFLNTSFEAMAALDAV